ncbi:S8 family serine peptidase [Limnoglobus roseus]|uniref:Peptidase S8/S53 domain-containing protein n=1 Tax=Limnoglobus roseus TaxID=2598579 RepID=A0A5C1AKD3_9BACT|nr:S8 family serine peptidase [Limnoglobus roseus]QEL18663.1 hypothetical protein PX52LOC_05697 [Limnoglobus roseus]
MSARHYLILILVFLSINVPIRGQEPDFEFEKRLSLATEARQAEFAKLLKTAPLNVRILDQRPLQLPDVKDTFTLYKISDTKTKTLIRIVADDGGKIVPYEEFAAQNREEHFKKHGCMQLALSRLVQRAAKDTSIPVLVQMDVPGISPDLGRREDDKPVADRKTIETKKTTQEEETLKLLTQLLRRLDAALPEGRFQSGPFVATRLPAGVIDRLSRQKGVLFVGMDQEKPVFDYPSVAQSLPTTRTQLVHALGAKGQGVKIAVLEPRMLTIDSSCFRISAIQDPLAIPFGHTTLSVGMIGNRYKDGRYDGPWQGYAPDAEVVLANDGSYQKAYEWARSNGLNVLTMSWHFPSEETNGDLHSRDVYFDYWAVRDPFPSIFTSAGNEAAASAFASGKGYHFFGVGDVRNDGDGNRANDTITSSSSWRNPTSGREVPAIAAPGTAHELLGGIHTGTSAATPAAAAIAAVLMCDRPQLKVWPEGVRAILLATANYQGSDGADWSPLSDGKDGTGLINAQYAHRTAKRREKGTQLQYRAHDYGEITAAQFQDGFFKKTWKAHHNIVGSRMRIAFTWNKGENCSPAGELDSDLDLMVFDPDMNEVASSMSSVNNYEFVEFMPTRVGSYTIKICGTAVPANFKSYFGVAWTAHSNIDP